MVITAYANTNKVSYSKVLQRVRKGKYIYGKRLQKDLE